MGRNSLDESQKLWFCTTCNKKVYALYYDNIDDEGRCHTCYVEKGGTVSKESS